MDIIRITPLAVLPNTVPQVLDYFWTTPLATGALVRVMIGRRAVTGVVLESLDIAQAKMVIKKSSFGLKKISSVLTPKPQVTAQQLSLARWMAQQYHVSLGLCLKTILPAWLGKRGKLLDLPIPSLEIKNSKLKISPEIILTQPNTAVDIIKKTIGKGTTLVIVPEVHLARHLGVVFANDKPMIVHSAIGIREQVSAHRAVLTGAPQLIIGTRLALFLPFASIDHLIIEDPLHEAYKSDMAPRYATADIARELAKLHGASMTYLTPSFSTVNYHLIKQKMLAATEAKPYWPRIICPDMALEQQDNNYTVFSREAKDIILDAYEDEKSLLLFSARKAYASLIMCKHCRKPLLCTTCDIPMRAHRTSEDMAVCYHCTAYLNIPKQCSACHAGALVPTGLAGSQKIAESVNTLLDRHGLPKLTIPILDSDLIRTDADESAVLTSYDEMQHPMIVATQMIFSHRYVRRFDAIIVAQTDALTYSPDFRTQERLIYQLEKLADFKPRVMVLQSWDVRGALLHARERSWSSWCADELSERKTLAWPPYSRIIKITQSHKDRSTCSRLAVIVADKLKRAISYLKVTKSVTILGPAPALVEHSQGIWRNHILIKTTLAPAKIHELLTYVPSGVTIDVDPRSVA